MKIYWLATSSLVVLAICASARTSLAQTAAAGDQASSGTAANVEEIVVTARRRAEKIEDVPATIHALTADALVEQGVHTEADLQVAVPGLVIRTGNLNNQLNYVIRGESIDSYSGSVPGVQPYVNEVAISTNGSSTFYDLDSVQVLKGPQGTLFGRNTTGGAVLYQTKQPGDTLGGYLSVQYGNLDRLITEGALNVPVNEKLAIRVAGTYTEGGGYEHNLYDGSTLGDQSTKSGRITILLKPTDNLTNLTTAEFTGVTGTNLNPQIYYAVPCGQSGGFDTCNYTASNPAFHGLLNDPPGTHFHNYPAGFVYPGGLPTYANFISKYGAYTGDWNAPSKHSANSQFVANTTTLDLDWVTIKNIIGYDRTYSGNLYDDDGTPYPLLQSGAFYVVPGGDDLETTNTEDVSDELQFQGKTLQDQLTYIVGFYYDHNTYAFSSPITGTGILQATPGDPSTSFLYSYAVRYHTLTTTDTYAAFAQATYALTDRLNLTGGIRYTWTDISGIELAGSVFGEGHPEQASENDPSWTATLDYKVTPELMAYVTTRGSWRIGGYSTAGVPAGDTVTAADGGNYFLPETVKDVEVGAKYNGHLGGIPFQINADFFNTWIDNVQKIAYFQINGNIASNTVNVPETEITGLEGDVQIRPTDWLSLGGNVSYNYARFTENKVILFNSPTLFGPYGDVPRFSGSAYADVNMPLAGDLGTLGFRTDVYAQSSFYFSSLGNTLNPVTQIPGYALVNMRVDWFDPMGVEGVTASLFVKNLFDRVYYTGGNPGAQDESIEAVNYGLPRTYGFVLRYSF